MKQTLLILFIFISARLLAPSDKQIPLAHESALNPFKTLINAIGKVESGLDTLAYNPKEQATGFFQVRPIRLEDYNRRTGSEYILHDMFDYEKAEKVFMYYASEIGPYDMERIARNWNGKWELTDEYWKKVKAKL